MGALCVLWGGIGPKEQLAMIAMNPGFLEEVSFRVWKMAKLPGLAEGMHFPTPSTVLESATLLAISLQSEAIGSLWSPLEMIHPTLGNPQWPSLACGDLDREVEMVTSVSQCLG